MHRALLFIFFLFISSISLSQDLGSIKGHITDGQLQDEPLLFAQVSLKNTSFTTETNFHGNFEFNYIETGDYILTINYLGYETLEIPVTVAKENLTIVDRSLEVKKVRNATYSSEKNYPKTTSTTTSISAASDK